jgi:hypothetical protein
MTITTDNAVLNVKPGDAVTSFHNGIRNRRIVKEVRYKGLCDNPRSGANGHAYAGLVADFGPTSTISFSIESDAYNQGSGYPTHNAAGERIRGFEIESAPIL